MNRRRSVRAPRDQREGPEQLPLVASAKPRAAVEPEQAAKVAIARRAKPSALPGHVKLVLTLDLRRSLAERLSAKAIREGKNLDGVVIDCCRQFREELPARSRPTFCSARCRAAWHRRRHADARAVRNHEIRALLQAAPAETGGGVPR